MQESDRILLSIIIPYYNTLKETTELLKTLIPQLDGRQELIIIEDGCDDFDLDNVIDDILIAGLNEYKEMPQIKTYWLKENSGGASKPRNIGLDNAMGKYITFIDSDDMISKKYIKCIMESIKDDPEVVFISWKSKVHNIKMDIKPPKWNCSVWSRVYSKKLIGKNRFDENLKIAEDWKFDTQLNYNISKCKSIRKTIYYYNNGRKGSLINSYKGDKI